MTSSPPKLKSERRLRRSKRLKLSVPVLVHGKTASGEPFSEITRMLSVNAHGGLLALATAVQKGQALQVENRSTRQRQECRVVNIGAPQDGRWAVAIEFTQVAADFWQICFPPVISN